MWNSKSSGASATNKKGRQMHLGSFISGERAAKCAPEPFVPSGF